MLSAMREMPSTASTLFSAYASFAGAIMLLRSAANDVVPEWLRSFLQSKLDGLFRTPEVSTLTLVFEESCGYIRNQVYEAAEIYLCTKVGPFTDRLKIRKTQKQKSFSIAMEKGEIVVDFYENIKLTWKFLCSESQNSEKRFFELSFEKKFREKVLDDYLPSVLARAKAIREEDKVLRLYTRDAGSFDDEDGGGVWGSIQLEHPATFETVAMDPELKKMIIDDLERFLRRKEFYKKVGKAWKRGYLLYGPPGTGKSSLIAAMANYLKFDIYDLELSSIYSNSDLRRVLVSTSNRSIIVIEDIDCTVQVRSREMEEGDDSSNPKMTLSGLLNFIDGLWSCCGDERIIIFTTNNKDILDPALLRPGRMDMHIHMSYCSLNVFRILCSNYLDITIEGHPLCVEIKSLLQDADVTPAEVAEELMRSDHPNVALGGVLNLVRRKKKERKQINEDEVKKDDGVAGEEDVL